MRSSRHKKEDEKAGKGKSSLSAARQLAILKMETERIFSADQIVVHPDLAKIIREYTKAVVRANPSDIVEYSAGYFKARVEAEEQKKQEEFRTRAEADALLQKE